MAEVVLTDPNAPWDDPEGREKGDNAWQAGLRLQQAWWRQEVAGLPAGSKTGGGRLVASMLPLGAPLSINLMTPEARDSYERAQADLVGRPGMIQEDRLRRNLLSSQPLCFNLFGYLSGHPESLLPWVQEFDPDAATITDVRLEWAPSSGTIGGSAFDAFVEYATAAGDRGFVGVECKYNEDLKKSLTNPAADKYIEQTANDSWKPSAGSALNRTGLRQFWFNQILTQLTKEGSGYGRAFGVVVACDADESARTATEQVSAQLLEPRELRFSSIEHVVSTIEGHDDWKRAFVQRYVDFSPIQDMLAPSDARRGGLAPA